MADPKEPGFAEGDACGRDGCAGVIEMRAPENCSCHLSAPCFSCTADRIWCPDCGWESAKDPLVQQDISAIVFAPIPYVETKRRVLDPTKVDFVSKMHSSCSMIKEGVYPQSGDDAADREMVRKLVDGTFGGRFESFGGGRFKFIAYTD